MNELTKSEVTANAIIASEPEAIAYLHQGIKAKNRIAVYPILFALRVITRRKPNPVIADFAHDCLDRFARQDGFITAQLLTLIAINNRAYISGAVHKVFPEAMDTTIVFETILALTSEH